MNNQLKKQVNTQHLGRFLAALMGMTFLAAGGGLLVGQLTREDVTGPVFLFVFAIVSASPLFWSRKNWWALIPTGLFLGGCAAATLDVFSPFGRASGPVYLFLLAGTFLAIFLLFRKHWWALMPGGLFFSLGLVATLENYLPHEEFAILHVTPALGVYFTNLDHSHVLGVYFWVLLLGLAATFGVLWLMRKSQPTGWARYPAVAFLVAAVLSFLLGSNFEQAWLASICLGAGIMLLMKVFSKAKPASSQQLTGTVK